MCVYRRVCVSCGVCHRVVNDLEVQVREREREREVFVSYTSR